MKKGSHHSEETKRRMTLSHSGVKNHMYGKTGEHHPCFGSHLSEETKEKIAATKRGKPRPPHVKAKLLAAHVGVSPSEETRARLSIAVSGKNHPFYGKHLSEEHKRKISMARIDRGIKLSPESIAKGAAKRVGRKHTPETIAKMSGKNCHLWRGGISFEPYCPKFNNDLRRRVRAFFEHRCVLCGKTESDNRMGLDVHHVEYNKSACCDGKPVHFAALCHSCHSKTSASSSRDWWENVMHRIIIEIYDGRSYYTKEEWKEMNK